MTRVFFSLFFLGVLVWNGAASAHHSLALFDREKTVTIEGTVKEFQWTNPHIEIEVVTDNAAGVSMLWVIQGGAPTTMARGGWKPSSVHPGDKISLSLHPRKDGASGGYYADELPLLVNGTPVAPKPTCETPDCN